MNAKQYLGRLVLFFLVILGSVAVFNYWINPYLVFPDRRISGLNAIKSDINNYIRQAKAHHPLQFDIDTLLVGNSRIEMGIRPNHQCLTAHTYNLGLPGAGIETQVAYTLNLIQQKSIHTVIMSLDFVDFLRLRARKPAIGFIFSGQQRLKYLINGDKNPEFEWNRLRDYYLSAVSLDALISSVKTVITQKPASATRTMAGFNPANELATATRNEGAFQVFQQKLNSLNEKYSRPWTYQKIENWNNSEYLSLKKLINTADEKNIKLVFFVSPLHQSFFDLLDKYDLANDYSRWFVELSDFLNKTSKSAIQLYDFARMPGFTDEPLPEANANSKELKWFWEPAHYKSVLGDQILDIMFESSCGVANVFTHLHG